MNPWYSKSWYQYHPLSKTHGSLLVHLIGQLFNQDGDLGAVQGSLVGVCLKGSQRETASNLRLEATPH